MGDRRRVERQDGRVPTQPVPTLRPGDAVIPGNRSGHKSPGGAQTVQDIAARFPFLPPYSPDLDPMEMAFSKLKTLKPKGRGADLRSAMAGRRTCPRPLLGREMLQLFHSQWTSDQLNATRSSEAFLEKAGKTGRIHHRKPKGRPMPTPLTKGNATKSKVRARVEHVFAEEKDRMGLRTIGIERAQTASPTWPAP